MSGRLARGRNYARAGQILDFTLTTGVVTARVQGSRPKPYLVRIKVLPLTTAQWRQVEAALARRRCSAPGCSPVRCRTRSRRCSRPAVRRCSRARRQDLDMFCSCPDWGVPCKHLAATCYVLAEAFDEDPFLMLAWRGRERADLLAALRRITADQAAVASAAAAELRCRGTPGSVPRGPRAGPPQR